MKEIRETLEQYKEISNLDEKATKLRNFVLSTKGLEFAEEIIDSIVRVGYVKCEINNAISIYSTSLTSLGNLIAGITNWSAEHFYVNGYGNIEDLTHDKVNLLIDEILCNIPEEEYVN